MPRDSHFCVAHPIVGGGMVAGYAAKKLVELGLKPGELTILSADTAIPYERPPLSKGFLLSRDDESGIRINPEGFYGQHGIELKLNCAVTSVDTNRRRLVLQGGEFGYESLIPATDSRARRLGVPGADLASIHYLRSMDNSKEIRQAAKGAK